VEAFMLQYRPPIRFRDRVQAVRVMVPDNSTPGAGSAVKEKRLVQFLADPEDVRLFNEVRDLVSANDPGMSFAHIMKIVFTEFRDRHSPVARHAHRQGRIGAASLDSRRRECGGVHSRHIPDEVRDEIFVRDHGACTYVGPSGTRCRSTRGVQVDHVTPFAAGGTHDPSNLRLLCGAHNRRAAEKAFGSWQKQYRRE
jgi:5-methylcytosine-specific restriction endonuclease McrA